MSEYTLGLVSISFRKHIPEEIIKAVKSAGLTCIEWGSDVHAPCRDTERLCAELSHFLDMLKQKIRQTV